MFTYTVYYSLGHGGFPVLGLLFTIAPFCHWEVLSSQAYWVSRIRPPKMNSSKSWESKDLRHFKTSLQCQGHHHQPCPQPSFNNAPWISSWVAVAGEIFFSILGLAQSHVAIFQRIDLFRSFCTIHVFL